MALVTNNYDESILDFSNDPEFASYHFLFLYFFFEKKKF